jgi:Domain of unknown function (DUF4936)
VRELFIYYRIHLDQLTAARAAVVSMQADLMAAHAHLQARVLYRPQAQGGFQTWMETYSTDPVRQPDGITVDLESAIESRAACLAPFIHGPRHVEVFVSCAS